METANLQGLCYFCPLSLQGCSDFAHSFQATHWVMVRHQRWAPWQLLQCSVRVYSNSVSFNEILLHCNNQKIDSGKTSNFFFFFWKEIILHLSKIFWWFCTSSIQKSLILLSWQCSSLYGRTLCILPYSNSEGLKWSCRYLYSKIKTSSGVNWKYYCFSCNIFQVDTSPVVLSNP